MLGMAGYNIDWDLGREQKLEILGVVISLVAGAAAGHAEMAHQ